MSESFWSEDEYRFIELLKTMTVAEAGVKMGYKSPTYGYNKVAAMRTKIDRCRATVNIAENWRKASPRIRKLLTSGGVEE